MNRSSRQEVFCEKNFSKILQNSQESTCARVSFLIKLQAQACKFIKKETGTKCLSTPFLLFLQNTSGGCFCNECQS